VNVNVSYRERTGIQYAENAVNDLQCLASFDVMNLLIDTERDEISSNNTYTSPWPHMAVYPLALHGKFETQNESTYCFLRRRMHPSIECVVQLWVSSLFPRKEDLPSPRWPPSALGSVESLRSISYPPPVEFSPKLDTGYCDHKGAFVFRVCGQCRMWEMGVGFDELIARSALSSWTLDIAYVVSYHRR
jgi:hypothetical protein